MEIAIMNIYKRAKIKWHFIILSSIFHKIDADYIATSMHLRNNRS